MRARVQPSSDQKIDKFQWIAGSYVSLMQTVLHLADSGRNRYSSGRKILPLGQSGGASFLVDFPADEMAFRVEMVVKEGMD